MLLTRYTNSYSCSLQLSGYAIQLLLIPAVQLLIDLPILRRANVNQLVPTEAAGSQLMTRLDEESVHEETEAQQTGVAHSHRCWCNCGCCVLCDVQLRHRLIPSRRLCRWYHIHDAYTLAPNNSSPPTTTGRETPLSPDSSAASLG